VKEFTNGKLQRMNRAPGRNTTKVQRNPAIGPFIRVPIMQAILKTGPGNSETIEKPDKTSSSDINPTKEDSAIIKGNTEAPPPITIEPILKNLSIR